MKAFPIEWLSVRFEGTRAPSSEDRERYYDAVSAGMTIIARSLGAGAVPPTEVQATMTVYPLTCCADIHAELVAALAALVDRDLTYLDGFVDREQIRVQHITRARAALAAARPPKENDPCAT